MAPLIHHMCGEAFPVRHSSCCSFSWAPESTCHGRTITGVFLHHDSAVLPELSPISDTQQGLTNKSLLALYPPLHGCWHMGTLPSNQQ